MQIKSPLLDGAQSSGLMKRAGMANHGLCQQITCEHSLSTYDCDCKGNNQVAGRVPVQLIVKHPPPQLFCWKMPRQRAYP